MTKFYKNNTNSPIDWVGIGDKQISLHGPKNILFMNSESHINNLFDYIERTSKEQTVPVEHNDETQTVSKSYINNLFSYIGGIFSKKSIPAENKDETQAVSPEIKKAVSNWFVNRDKLLREEGNEQYQNMKKIIDAKALEARQENKNLLVVIGEAHKVPASHLFQLFALDILNKNGVNKFLEEKSTTTSTIQYDKFAMISNYVNKNVLSNVLATPKLKGIISSQPIDPCHEGFEDQSISPCTREQEINRAILEQNDSAMCVVGAAHIHHITTDPQISEKYKLPTFDTANLPLREEYKNKSPEELKKLIEDQDIIILKKKEQIKNDISKCDSSELGKKCEDHVRLLVTKICLMKAHKPDKITNLSLERGDISSDTEALNIAIDVITANNPESKVIAGLKEVQKNYQQLEAIRYGNQNIYRSDIKLLNGEIDRLKHSKEKECMEEDSVSPAFLFNLTNDQSNESGSDNKSSDDAYDQQENVGLGSVGEDWDVWSHC